MPFSITVTGLLSLPLFIAFPGLWRLNPSGVEVGGASDHVVSKFTEPRFLLEASSIILIGLMAKWLVQGVVIVAVHAKMQGRTVAFILSLRSVADRYLPILATMICTLILTLLGVVALLIPSIIVQLVLSVVLPVCIIEGLGPFRSIRQSARLTKGFLWNVFPIWAMGCALDHINLSNGFLSGLPGGQIVTQIINMILDSWALVIEAILACVLYHDLRATHPEGVG